jgi:hypothetical protein
MKENASTWVHRCVTDFKMVASYFLIPKYYAMSEYG